jgi:hypothetical protein
MELHSESNHGFTQLMVPLLGLLPKQPQNIVEQKNNTLYIKLLIMCIAVPCMSVSSLHLFYTEKKAIYFGAFWVTGPLHQHVSLAQRHVFFSKRSKPEVF